MHLKSGRNTRASLLYSKKSDFSESKHDITRICPKCAAKLGRRAHDGAGLECSCGLTFSLAVQVLLSQVEVHHYNHNQSSYLLR